jgi:hypothetical protein
VVADNGRTSTPQGARAGIRQGCPLSPFLFVIVLHCIFADTDELLQSKGVHPNLLSPCRPLYDLEYADDVILMSPL